MNNSIVNSNDTSRSNVQLILTAIQSCIFIIGVTGNITTVLCLAWVHKRTGASSRTSLFIIHLCVADLAIAIFNVLPNICLVSSIPNACPVQDSDFSCKMTNFLSLLPVYGSTYMLIVTSCDRYVAICHPFKARSLIRKHVHIACGVTWFVAFLCSVPQLIIFTYDANRKTCVARWHNLDRIHFNRETVYLVWFACAVWLVPTLVLVFSYANILVAIRKSPGVADNRRFESRGRMIKPIRIMLTVTIGYILCWSPWMVSTIIAHFTPSTGNRQMYMIMTYLIGFNSCLNPFIYLVFNYRQLMITCRGNMRASNTDLQVTTGNQTLSASSTDAFNHTNNKPLTNDN